MFETLLERVDEMFGCGLLTSIAFYTIYVGFDGNIVGACVAGIIALLTVKEVKKVNGNEYIE